MTNPLGDLLTITYENQTASFYEVGATMHEYTIGDRSILDHGPDRTGIFDVYKGSHGALLMPWPNRVANGKYEFEAAELQLPINEVARGHASHGFARSLKWEVQEHSDAKLVLTTQSYAQVGYPFVFNATMTYELSDAGLSVRIHVRNNGTNTLPFGVGMHPYFVASADAILTVPATQYEEVNDVMIPVGEPVSVLDTKYDLREGVAVASLDLDTPYTGLLRDHRGFCVCEIDDVKVWMDESFEYIMVYTGAAGTAAVEPMSCAPNAFNNGRGLRLLKPDETFDGTWGVFVG